MEVDTKMLEKVACHICGKMCGPKMLKKHIRTHTNLVLYDCDKCCSRFTSKKILNVHMKIHDKYTFCENCGRRNKIADKLRNHVCSGGKEKNYNCQFCIKSFFSKYELTRHTRSHTNEKPYECQFCDKRFSQKSNRNIHSLTHQEHNDGTKIVREKKYVCEICCSTFSYAQSLSRHRYCHTSVRPHECSICGKDFTQKWELKRHIKIHTIPVTCNSQKREKKIEYKSKLQRHKKPNKEEFSCPHCEKTFFSKGGLQKHFKNKHSLLQTYTCHLCDIAFSTHTHLKKHYLLHDSQEESNVEIKNERTDYLSKSSDLNLIKRNEDSVLNNLNDNFNTTVDLSDALQNHINTTFDKVCSDLEEGSEISSLNEKFLQETEDTINTCNIEQFKNFNGFETKEKFYPCHICRMQLQSEMDLEVHHTQFMLVKIQCCKCNRVFSSILELVDHQKTHKIFIDEDIQFETKPYICTICQKIFTNQSLLNDHKVKFIHDEIQCCLCNSQFNTQDDLNEHHLIHDNWLTNKPHLCIITKSEI